MWVLDTKHKKKTSTKGTQNCCPGMWGLLCVPFFMSAGLKEGERGIIFDGEMMLFMAMMMVVVMMSKKR